MRRLTICFQTDEASSLNEGLFAHIPQLCEFTISYRTTAVGLKSKRLPCMDDAEKQRTLILAWEKHCPKLRLVAFQDRSAYTWAKFAKTSREEQYEWMIVKREVEY